MNKTTLKLATIIGVAAAMTVPALAQESKPLGLSVKAGLFFPTSSVARNQGNTWFAFGASYKLMNLEFGTMERGYSSELGLSVDYMSKGDMSSLPILGNYVIRQNQLFYSVGAGLTFAKELNNNNTTRNRTMFAYQLGIGYEFVQSQTPFFVEARYLGTQNSDLNGFGLFVGVRL